MGIPKELLNRITAPGSNFVLTDDVRAALLEEMIEIPLDHPAADLAGVDPPEGEIDPHPGDPADRVNYMRLTPTSRMQAEVTLALTTAGGQGIVYGPLNRPRGLGRPCSEVKEEAAAGRRGT